MAGSVAFLLDVLLLGVSYFLHLVGVELEEVRHAAKSVQDGESPYALSTSAVMP